MDASVPRDWHSYSDDGEVLPPADPSPRSGYDDYVHPPEPQYQPPPQRRGFAAAPATYILIGINIAVFLLMVVTHVSPWDPDPGQLVHWGANIGYADYLGYGDLHGEWWRLVTAMFVHGGIVHLGANMWCLWNLGMLGEQLVGRDGIFFIYLLTGAAGNLLSTFNNSSIVAVGASGAVFGIAGVLIVLLSNTRLPVPIQELRRLRRSVLYFAVINFIIGFGANTVQNSIRIDNSAHLGGCISGLVLGALIMPAMMLGRERYRRRQRIVFFAAAFALSLAGYWIANFRRS